MSIAKLHEYGFTASNANAAWAATLLLVPKEPPASFCMTLSNRPMIAATEKRLCSVSSIEPKMGDVSGSPVFAEVDLTSGYWQLPLHPDRQDALSFMTPNGVCKLLRTAQGAKTARKTSKQKWNSASLHCVLTSGHGWTNFCRTLQRMKKRRKFWNGLSRYAGKKD